MLTTLRNAIRACPRTHQARTPSAALLQGFASAISRPWLLASSGEPASLVREHYLWSIRVVLLSLPYYRLQCFWGRLLTQRYRLRQRISSPTSRTPHCSYL